MTPQAFFLLTGVLLNHTHRFMPRIKMPKSDVPVTFRLPIRVQQILIDKARREDLNFSQLVRRALRREVTANKIRMADSK